MLEQRLHQQEAQLHERDSQIHKLTEIVEQAKRSLQQLAIEADSETSELQAEIISMKEKLDSVADETRSRQEVEQLDQKLAESEATCQALRWELDAVSARPAVTSVDDAEQSQREVIALRAEAVRLRELQQLQWQQHSTDAQRFRAELTALRAALRKEGLPVDSLVAEPVGEAAEAAEVQEAKMESRRLQQALETSQGLATDAQAETASLRQENETVQAALEAERRSRRQASESLLHCEEVAARLMAERNAAKEELEDFSTSMQAFKQQAASVVNEGRWAHCVLRLLRVADGSALDDLKESWSDGVRKWQAFSNALTDKLNTRPTAVFAQEIAGHCTKGDKALQALDDRVSAQGQQMAAMVDRAMQEFRQAQEAWKARLTREHMLRLAAEEDLREQLGKEEPTGLPKGPKAVDLLASLEEERSQVDKLKKQLAEAEQTIGSLVVQSLEPAPAAKKAQTKTPSGSLRSRSKSSIT